jgi:AraC-like DNA-binding protein
MAPGPNPSPARASTWFLRILAGACRAHGLDPAPILTATGIDPAALITGEGRIPLRAARAAWEEAARRSGDPHFGLHAAERLPPGSFDVLEYLGRSVATFGEMLVRVARLVSVVTEDGSLSLRHTPRGVVLSHTARAPLRHPSELLLASVVLRGRAHATEALAPLSVSFMHAAPADLSEHARIFRAPVRFGQSTDSLRFSAETAALPLHTYEPGLSAILDAYATQLTARTGATPDVLVDVGDAITAALGRGEPRLEDVARVLAITPRTLQRRLQEAGTTFQARLDDVRHQLALELLEDPNLPTSKLALQLGFSEPSAFYRAYQRWTGESPTRARRGALPAKRRRS